MKWKPVIAIIITGGLTYAGYKLYKYFHKQKNLLSDYQISLLKIQLTTISESVLAGNFTLRITNKSAIEATITDAYSDVYLNGTYMGIGSLKKDKVYVVPANGSNDIGFDFTFAHKEILKNIVSDILTLITTKDIGYRLNGSVALSSGGVTVPPLAFDYNGSIKQDVFGSAAPTIKTLTQTLTS